MDRGTDHLCTLKRGVRQMRGSMSQQNVADASAFERAHYVSSLHSYKPE